MKYIPLLLAFLSISLSAYAQDEENHKKNKDFFQIKAPAIEYSKPDIEEILFEEEIKNDVEDDEEIYFRPERELSIMAEDSTSAEDGELSIVEVSEQLRMDSVWITIAEYYAIWDSRSVNPYKIDPTSYKDSIPFKLFDEEHGFTWSMPLDNCQINSAFGMRHYRWHYGTDLNLNIGDPVYASFDGIVRINKYDAQGYGNYVMLRHYNGLETLYGHLSKSNVQVGQLVKAGELIGLGGSTGRSSGPHLHYEIRYEGNAVDPEFVYDFRSSTIRGDQFTLLPSHFDYVRVARQVVYHKVRSGDTLFGISKKYKVPVNTICKLNGISTKSVLKVGMKLRIR